MRIPTKAADIAARVVKDIKGRAADGGIALPFLAAMVAADYVSVDKVAEPLQEYVSEENLESELDRLEAEMQTAAKELAFEKAAMLRDQIAALKKAMPF